LTPPLAPRGAASPPLAGGHPAPPSCTRLSRIRPTWHEGKPRPNTECCAEPLVLARAHAVQCPHGAARLCALSPDPEVDVPRKLVRVGLRVLDVRVQYHVAIARVEFAVFGRRPRLHLELLDAPARSGAAGPAAAASSNSQQRLRRLAVVRAAYHICRPTLIPAFVHCGSPSAAAAFTFFSICRSRSRRVRTCGCARSEPPHSARAHLGAEKRHVRVMPVRLSVFLHGARCAWRGWRGWAAARCGSK
jgi:hypothetical protein